MTRFLCILACCLGGRAFAGIVLDEARDAIRITDYPPECPCTLARLAAVDRAFGWNRVSHDAAQDAYTVRGTLIVGANDEWNAAAPHGTETVLRIGSADHPRETLIMRGDLFVAPYWIAGENPAEYWSAARKRTLLRIGDPHDPGTRASLKFACGAGACYTLYCGRLPWNPAPQFGGGVEVYHGEISALDPDAGLIGDAARGDLHLYGSVVLDHARLADVKGRLAGLSGGGSKEYRLNHTRFERIGAALVNGIQKASGCTFAHCGTAVLDQGGLRAELSGCLFQSNACNWSLRYTGKLSLVDCAWEPPSRHDEYRVWTNRQGQVTVPALTVSRHIVAEVTDAAGRPVPGAAMTWRAEQDAEADRQARPIVTGADGLTPGPDHAEQALLLKASLTRATDIPNQPDTISYSYTLTAEKDGARSTLTGVTPDVSWMRVRLILD